MHWNCQSYHHHVIFVSFLIFYDPIKLTFLALRGIPAHSPCLRACKPLAYNRFAIKCGQFSSNLWPITPVISLPLENILTITPWTRSLEFEIEKLGRNGRKTLFCSPVPIHCNFCPDYPWCIVKCEKVYFPACKFAIFTSSLVPFFPLLFFSQPFIFHSPVTETLAALAMLRRPGRSSKKKSSYSVSAQLIMTALNFRNVFRSKHGKSSNGRKPWSWSFTQRRWL